MPTLRIKTRHRRGPRTLAGALTPRIGPAVQAQSPPPPDARTLTTPPADATWQAIVEQLLAAPSDPEPSEAQPDTEYAWARRMGMHINRPPKRRPRVCGGSAVSEIILVDCWPRRTADLTPAERQPYRSAEARAHLLAMAGPWIAWYGMPSSLFAHPEASPADPPRNS
jgi:hypothetical protein